MPLANWLQPCSENPPCGDALDYDAQFIALDQLTVGKPERQYGDTIIPPEAPDWRAVRAAAEPLLDRSKDVRVAVHLARALLEIEGVAGFASALQLIRHMLDEWWEPLHPQLVIDGESDPFMRSNAIAGLSDREGLLGALRLASFVDARGIRVAIKDAELALGVQQTEGAEVTRDQLVGLIADALTNNAEAFSHFDRCAESITAIDAVCKQKFDSQQAPDLVGITRLFSTLAAAIGDVKRASSGEAEAAAETAVAGVVTEGAIGTIKSRADAIRAIDAICRYFEQNEPTSPAPIFLKRAKKLVGMNFLDIMKDIAPDSLQRIGIITGEAAEES